MLWVERFSFLPDLQRDGGDLTRQRQPRHLWLHSFIQEPKVELLKDPAAGAGCGRGPLNKFFSSWLWFQFNPRTNTGLFLRSTCPLTTQYSPLSRVSSASPQ